jgi:hypothetical protein
MMNNVHNCESYTNIYLPFFFLNVILAAQNSLTMALCVPSVG